MSAAEDRRYWRDRARAVLPSATSREVVRAAHLLRECYDVPTVTYDAYGSTLAADTKPRSDASMFAGRTGGGVPDHSPAPSAYDARRHDLKPSGEVGRRGRARVQGGSVATCPDTPLGASVGLLSQMLEDLPRNVVGALAWDVEALGHLFYGASIPELLGSDTIAYRQVVHAAPESDPYTARGVVGRESAESKTATWPTRTRLANVRARKSEHVTPGRLIAPAYDYRGRTIWTRREFQPVPSHREFVCTGRVNHVVCGYLGYWRDTLPVDSVTDHSGRPIPAQTVGIERVTWQDAPRVFIGHKCQPRGKVAARKPRTVKLDRTIGMIETTGDMLAVRAVAAAAALNRGERVIIVADGVTLTPSRGKSEAGTFGLGVIGGPRADGIRTPKAVAAQALKLTA